VNATTAKKIRGYFDEEDTPSKETLPVLQ
jgi:hypothetical protein